MTAYNKDWLEALWVRENAGEWREAQLLSEEKWAAIQMRFMSHFYSPNIFIRIGLAIFCSILISAGMGLTAIAFEPDSSLGFAAFSIFWGIVCLVLLETWAIGNARHRASGLDDMLLYYGVGAILGGIFSTLHYSTSSLLHCCIALPFLLAGSIRYIDRLMAAATFICALLIVLLVVKDVPKLALYLLPFAGMAFSVGAYLFARKGQQRYAWRYWHDVLWVVEMLALGAFYASGNYWVIQEAGAAMFELEQPPIPWFFWAFTFGVPAIYIYLGVKRANRLMLDIGLACVGLAVFTFRYYYHVLPIAWASAIGGGILFAVAYFSIQYLRKNEDRYTYAAQSDTTMLQEIEQQLIEQTIANQPTEAPNPNEKFGGGRFGGGGASGEF
jgi:hypothetical protein